MCYSGRRRDFWDTLGNVWAWNSHRKVLHTSTVLGVLQRAKKTSSQGTYMEGCEYTKIQTCCLCIDWDTAHLVRIHPRRKIPIWCRWRSFVHDADYRCPKLHSISANTIYWSWRKTCTWICATHLSGCRRRRYFVRGGLVISCISGWYHRLHWTGIPVSRRCRRQRRLSDSRPDSNHTCTLGEQDDIQFPSRGTAERRLYHS